MPASTPRNKSVWCNAEPAIIATQEAVGLKILRRSCSYSTSSEETVRYPATTTCSLPSQRAAMQIVIVSPCTAPSKEKVGYLVYHISVSLSTSLWRHYTTNVNILSKYVQFLKTVLKLPFRNPCVLTFRGITSEYEVDITNYVTDTRPTHIQYYTPILCKHQPEPNGTPHNT